MSYWRNVKGDIGVVKNYDFMYSGAVDYDDSGYHSCERSGCDDEGICRCYTITDVSIYNINLVELRKIIMKRIGNVRGKDLSFIIADTDTEMNAYCIDRILSKYKVYTSEAWEAEWNSDYYGESVNSIKLVDSSEIEKRIHEVIAIDEDIDKLKYVLQMEYGNILPEVDGTELVIETVSATDVVLSSTNRANTLDKSDTTFYEKFDLPRAVCYEKNGKYVAVDGHTRLTANKKETVKIIVIR
jgi:hypothetical protein